MSPVTRPVDPTRMRVGVRSYLTRYPGDSGHGRVWTATLAALRTLVDLVECDMPPPSPVDAPAVWLIDGHGGPHHVTAPCVAVAHEAGWTTVELRSFLDPRTLDHLDAMTRHAVASAACVVTPSASAAGEIVELYGADPDSVVVVPYGVDHDVFHPRHAQPREIAEPYVLFCATLFPRKNLATVREAVARLAREGYPHRLVLVAGDSADRQDSSDLERAATAELVGAPGRIVRIRKPSDTRLASLMTHADAVCMPSFSEGFGLTVLEAMACGAPVVVSDRGSLPELVGHGGLCVAPTVEAVTEALRSILSDRTYATELSRRAATRAAEFSWERTAHGWHAVLQRCVSAP